MQSIDFNELFNKISEYIKNMPEYQLIGIASIIVGFIFIIIGLLLM